MDTLSLVSKYLNGLEDYLDDGDSLEARKLTKERSRAYSKPFTRFSLPCDVDGQGAWDAELDMAISFNTLQKKDIPVDKELNLLLGRPFLRTCGAIIDKGRSTLCIDDGVTRRTYFPMPRAKAYLDNFKLDEEDDWMSCFEVGRDEDGNPKYGPIAPSFLDIEDHMERALAMKAYFNPFKNIIVLKKLVGFLVPSSPIAEAIDGGMEGHGVN
ncbi:hypothetical protein Tco_1003776 [Tanacetum coccineum]|uniref:Uncharacterized protein n=1 Tax=Tanacetum coccineum TaxID=301880 RepID=A0ABQ5FBH4_9ASTR